MGSIRDAAAQPPLFDLDCPQCRAQCRVGYCSNHHRADGHHRPRRPLATFTRTRRADGSWANGPIEWTADGEAALDAQAQRRPNGGLA